MALTADDISTINQLIADYIGENKTKVSNLPDATTLTGLSILGLSEGLSVKASMALLKGLDGKNPEFRKTATEIQWRLDGGVTWSKLIDLADIRGFKTTLQKTATEIQWKYENDEAWTTLLALSELKGDKGDTGEKGDKGDTGLKGDTGVKGDKGDTGLKGDTGAKGDKGDAGAPNTLSIGTVTGGANASATITGTAPNQTLNMVLPKGDKGDTGLKGDKGDTGLKGDTGDVGKSAYQVWLDAGNTGTLSVYLASLKGAKGDKGDTGLKGDTGAKGDKGDTGLKGDTGAKGDKGDAGYTPVIIDNYWYINGVNTGIKALGENGLQTELQKTTTHIQWRLGTGSWANLIPLSDIKGATGVGLPIGGVAGQQLTKKSATDYDFEWQTPAGAGDMLKSVYDSDGDGIVDNAEKVNNHTVEADVPAGAKFTDTIYSHPTSDGNLHVPATGTTNNGKVLKAGATAGSLAWGTDNDTITTINGKTGPITKADIVALGIPAQDTVYTHPAGTNPHGTTKADVGLGNVDNILQASKTEFDTHNSDSTRHITSAERTAWNAKGSSNLALGETSATAYRGDRGKTAYDHSQTAHAPANAQKNSDITKAEIEAKLTGDINTHTHNQYIESSKFQVVTSLPASPVSGTFYFVKE